VSRLNEAQVFAYLGSSSAILDGLRHKYLGGPGVSCHARADCHAKASDLAVDQLALAGVCPCSYLDTQIAYREGPITWSNPRSSLERERGANGELEA
jgi:hypothetical protein